MKLNDQELSLIISSLEADTRGSLGDDRGEAITSLLMKLNRERISSSHLIQLLAGELEIYPALFVEHIQESEDLKRILRSYRSGEYTYDEVVETVKEFV
jgi:hypothetical protein